MSDVFEREPDNDNDATDYFEVTLGDCECCGKINSTLYRQQWADPWWCAECTGQEE